MDGVIRIRTLTLVAGAMLLAVICTLIITEAWSAGAAGQSGAAEVQPSGDVHGVKSKEKHEKKAPDPIGIGSHGVFVGDRVVFGDYEFTGSGGNYSLTFFDAGCALDEPAPVIFTNAGADRSVGVQGWGCPDGDLAVFFTAENGDGLADFDFDWIVYRGVGSYAIAD